MRKVGTRRRARRDRALRARALALRARSGRTTTPATRRGSSRSAATGGCCARWRSPGPRRVDWEDIAIRGRTLYVGDIGDNARAAAGRRRLPLRRAARRASTSVAATRIVLRYPDGAHDAEALLVDPRSGTIAIVTKDFGGASRRLRRRQRARCASGRRCGSASARRSRPATSPPTAARSSCAATTARSSGPRRAGESLARALRRAPCTAGADLIAEGQGESLALTRDGRAFYTRARGRAARRCGATRAS